MKSKQQPRYVWYGGRHLAMIFICGIMYFINTILSSGSTNTVFPLLSELNGWNNNVILVTMTVAGYIGAVCILIGGSLVMKTGAKRMAVFCLLATGITTMFWGVTKSLVVFVIILIVQRFFLVGFNNCANPALVSAWWPRKKGVVLGWATMGVVLSDIVWGPYIPDLVERFGARNTFLVAGGLIIVFAIVVAFVVKDTPEEFGLYPDGAKEGAEDAREVAKSYKEYHSPWTVKRVLKTKQAWLIILGYGFLWMCSAMFLNQIVPRITSLGYDSSFGVTVLQAAAICALFGSWFLGFLDQKIGTKRTSQIFAIWQSVMFILGILQHQNIVFIWISTLGLMAGVGGICNLIPSMIISIWGRWDFTAVNRVISFVMDIIRCSAFAMITVFLKTPWGYDTMYLVSAIVSVICVILISNISTKPLGKQEFEVAENTAKAE